MKTAILYGKGVLNLNLPDNTSIIQPKFRKGLENPKESIKKSLKTPINSDPLKNNLRKIEPLRFLYAISPELNHENSF